MIYIFAIIFSVIQCKFVKYNINEYNPFGYVAYSINNGKKIEISSFNEYLYSKTLELDVFKNYELKVYYLYQNNDNYDETYQSYYITTSLLMQLEEYEKVKKNNNDFNIMFCPNGSNVDRTGKIFFEFLKNNNFPKILITSNNNKSVFDLGEIKLYDRYEKFHTLSNEFIHIQGEYYYNINYNDYILDRIQLYYIEKNMMFYIYYLYTYFNDETDEISFQAEITKSILDVVKKTEDNREQFKSIPKVFIIVGKYKFDSISKSIFLKLDFLILF